MTLEHIEALHRQCRELISRGNLDGAVERVAGLAGREQEINSGECAHLYWSFCEQLGDHVASKDPVLAAALYRLALESNRKAASYATSGAEGHSLMLDVHRVEERLARVERAAPPKR